MCNWRNTDRNGGGERLSLDDFAGPQAASTDVNALGSTLDQGTNSLDVWIPTTVGTDVGVAHALTERRLFAAYLTDRGHRDTFRE